MGNESIETRVALLEEALVGMKTSLETHANRILTDRTRDDNAQLRRDANQTESFGGLEAKVGKLAERVNIGFGILLVVNALIPLIIYFITRKP